MATNKAKRSTRLSQPSRLAQPTRPSLNHEPAPLLPVRAHVYQAIAELNSGLEQVVHNLNGLANIGFLQAASLKGVHNLICRLRAQTNRQLMTILTEREMSDASHFDRIEWESAPEGPVSN